MLTKKCSEQVTFFQAEGAEELEELKKVLPPTIGNKLSTTLKAEGKLCRYDPTSRCEYHIERRGRRVMAWLWCDLGLQASSDMLTSIAITDKQTTDQMALDIYAAGKR